MTGGSNDSVGVGPGGAVFELTPPASAGEAWTGNVLYSFPDSYEAPINPFSGVFVGSRGVLYGTAHTSHYYTGFGVWGGSVFRLTPPSASGESWTESSLWDFYVDGASLGVNPAAGVVSVDGSLYGTTVFSDDGVGCGLIYQLSPPTGSGGAWTGTAIHSFNGPSGDGIICSLLEFGMWNGLPCVPDPPATVVP